ncbi:MAG: DUF4390 domain-containing protein [Desulfohalobiaceae bacterium]
MACFRLLLLCFTLFIYSLLSFPLQIQAQDLEFQNVVLDNVSGSIQVNFGIEVLDVHALEEHLSEGLVLQMVCKAKLIRNRRWWMDKLLHQEEQKFELKSQPLQDSYVLQRKGWENNLKDQDLGQLLNKAWSRLRLQLGSWEELKSGEDYAIELHLSLKRSNVPWWLRKSLFFWSWDLVPEKNYRMDFKY